MGERCKLPQRVQARLANDWVETSACQHHRRHAAAGGWGWGGGGAACYDVSDVLSGRLAGARMTSIWRNAPQLCTVPCAYTRYHARFNNASSRSVARFTRSPTGLMHRAPQQTSQRTKYTVYSTFNWQVSLASRIKTSFRRLQNR